MVAIALGVLKTFWKPILLGGLLIGGIWYIKHWDTTRLNKAYDRGYNAAFADIEREEKRIIRRSEEIATENARELNFLENQQEIKREVVYEQINTYIKETVVSCPITTEYLGVWDNIRDDYASIVGGTINSSDRGNTATEMPSPASAGNSTN